MSEKSFGICDVCGCPVTDPDHAETTSGLYFHRAMIWCIQAVRADERKKTAQQCQEIARGSVRHNPVPDAEWAAGWIEREISEQFGLEGKQ